MTSRQITTLSSASKNRRQVQSLPIREPIAWHGPIVMNTREELIQAVTELRNGTFIKG